MIDFELSPGLKAMQQMTHSAAEMAMRPISREYDEREHEKPWDFLNMMWQVSHSNPIGAAEVFERLRTMALDLQRKRVPQFEPRE